MISYQYSYLIGNLITLLIWIVLFLYKKKLRKEMLIMSILVTPLGPISEFFYFRDYWNPSLLFNIFGFGIEDLIFAFAVGGIASVIYEDIFIKKMKKTTPVKLPFFIFWLLSGIIVFIFLNLVLKINSMHASPIAFLFSGIIILFKRKDLIKNAFLSGLLVALIVFFAYVIFLQIFPSFFNKFWQLENIFGIYVLGIPIEELIWGFSWGFLAGPFYEFWKGDKEK